MKPVLKKKPLCRLTFSRHGVLKPARKKKLLCRLTFSRLLRVEAGAEEEATVQAHVLQAPA